MILKKKQNSLGLNCVLRVAKLVKWALLDAKRVKIGLNCVLLGLKDVKLGLNWVLLGVKQGRVSTTSA